MPFFFERNSLILFEMAQGESACNLLTAERLLLFIRGTTSSKGCMKGVLCPAWALFLLYFSLSISRDSRGWVSGWVSASPSQWAPDWSFQPHIQRDIQGKKQRSSVVWRLCRIAVRYVYSNTILLVHWMDSLDLEGLPYRWCTGMSVNPVGTSALVGIVSQRNDNHKGQR